MREILFRGKEKRTRKWTFGFLSYSGGDEDSSGEFLIVNEGGWFSSVVDSETVGQYTGLTDMNGKKVWEGDIVQCYTCGWDEEDGPGVIRWDEDTARFIIENDGVTFDFDIAESDEIEVIGNIHDNPELLEADAE